MTGLPDFGDKVWIWPFPGRKAHFSARPIDTMGGGRWLSDEGEEIMWSPWHMNQLLAGDILLHDPRPQELK